jgi:hypothetical protein
MLFTASLWGIKRLFSIGYIGKKYLTILIDAAKLPAWPIDYRQLMFRWETPNALQWGSKNQLNGAAALIL